LERTQRRNQTQELSCGAPKKQQDRRGFVWTTNEEKGPERAEQSTTNRTRKHQRRSSNPNYTITQIGRAC
jgi:hypothetical protein